MALTASALRANIYKILDSVLETGKPVEIVRGGKRLKIVATTRPGRSKLSRLPRHARVLRGNPEDLVDIDWSDTWRP